MSELWDLVNGSLRVGDLAFGRAFAVLLLGMVLAWGVRLIVAAFLTRRTSRPHAAVASRVTFYLASAVVVITALKQLGLELSVLLGAAGVLTVALGFASQTSASNLISGLFLIGERPFVVGDILKVETYTGEVVSIDLLSVKLRTFDNLSVRVPNESLLKSSITNLTRYPIRRVDLILPVALHQDMAQVREVLEQVADRNPLALDEPAPLVLHKSFDDFAHQIQFSIWGTQESYVDLKSAMADEAIRALVAAGVEAPSVHRTLAISPEVKVDLRGADGS